MKNRKGEREKKRKRRKGRKKAGQREEEGTRTGRTRKPIIKRDFENRILGRLGGSVC